MSIFLSIAIVSCSDDDSSKSNTIDVPGALDNNTDWGSPHKLSKQDVKNTLDFSFAVFGDPQPDLNLYTTTYCTWKEQKGCYYTMRRIGNAVDNINGTALDEKNFVGVVGVGDLTQHTCVQELIAFRQFFEYDYPGHDGGAISCADDHYDRYNDGYSIDYPVFPGLGNHDDPTGVNPEHTEACPGKSCHHMNNSECHADYVAKYIRARVSGSDALYHPPTTLSIHLSSDYNEGDIYAWEWGSYHFIMGNIWMFYHNMGARYETSSAKKQWLKDYLADVVGDSGKPVVLFQHYGWDCQSESWWHDHNKADLIEVLYNNGKPYNVIGIFTGHLHEFDYHHIHMGKDSAGNDVYLDNYVVNDSGPANNGDKTGHFIVRLMPDPDDRSKGRMEIYRHTIKYDNGSDNYSQRSYMDDSKPWHSKSFNLAFLDWDQGEPNNDNGKESCGVCKSNGRFDDRECNKSYRVAYKAGSEWRVTTTEYTWFDAPKACEGLGKFTKPGSLNDQYDLIKLLDEGEAVWINTRSAWIALYEIPGWYDSNSAGGGIAIGDINGKGGDDLISVHVNNSSDSSRSGYYRIGWDIDAREGTIAEWTAPVEIPGEFGNTDGAGLTMGNIDDDVRPDLIVVYIADPAGSNKGYYRIGWNVDAKGNVAEWTDSMEITGWFGDNTDGAGITIGNIDDNARPDLIVTHIDDHSGENNGYYRIGWNVDKEGTVSEWSDPISISGWFGDHNAGAGITIGDINNDASNRPDLIMTHIDNPEGENKGYYRIGWDVNMKGDVSSWSDPFRIPGWFGDNSQGAGITIGDIDEGTTDNDIDDRPDLVFFHVDNPDGLNHGYYRVGLNVDKKGRLLPFSVGKD